MKKSEPILEDEMPKLEDMDDVPSHTIRRCSFCDFETKFSEHLYRHEQMHTGQMIYTCPICRKDLIGWSSFYNHQRNSHLDTHPIQCPNCMRRFLNLILLGQHLCNVCEICQISCKNMSQLHRHYVVMHRGKIRIQSPKHQCSICDVSFTTKKGLSLHYDNTHGKKFCKLCNLKFSSAFNMKLHVNKLHAKKYVCSDCGKKTLNLKEHAKLHQEYYTIQCKHCECKLKTQDDLLYHISQKHTIKQERG